MCEGLCGVLECVIGNLSCLLPLSEGGFVSCSSWWWGGSGEVRRGDVEGRGEFLPPCGNKFRLWRNRYGNTARISYLNGIITRFSLVLPSWWQQQQQQHYSGS